MSRVNALLCVPVSTAETALVARVEDDEAALLHEGVDLGERRVGEGLGVLAHRPVKQGEEGELVLIDVDAHRVGRLEGGAGAQHLAQTRQTFLADAIDIGVAGNDVSEVRLKRGLEREVVGGVPRRLWAEPARASEANVTLGSSVSASRMTADVAATRRRNRRPVLSMSTASTSMAKIASAAR